MFRSFSYRTLASHNTQVTENDWSLQAFGMLDHKKAPPAMFRKRLGSPSFAKPSPQHATNLTTARPAFFRSRPRNGAVGPPTRGRATGAVFRCGVGLEEELPSPRLSAPSSASRPCACFPKTPFVRLSSGSASLRQPAKHDAWFVTCAHSQRLGDTTTPCSHVSGFQATGRLSRAARQGSYSLLAEARIAPDLGVTENTADKSKKH